MVSEPAGESGQADEGQEEPAFAKDRLVLADLVSARIEELHITRKEIEKRFGVSTATIREIEHPRRKRTFGRDVLDPLSVALEWPPDYLVRAVYRSSSEAPDPIVEEMMAALAPYLAKIDGLQQDVAAIRDGLGIRPDVIHPVDTIIVSPGGVDQDQGKTAR